MAAIRELRPATRPLQRIAERVVAHSVDILRVCLGLLIAGSGALKFFPGVSPAQPLVTGGSMGAKTPGLQHGFALASAVITKRTRASSARSCL